ncbi:MAG: DsrE/DsrF/TusD sulfur relay family protein [bacterium]
MKFLLIINRQPYDGSDVVWNAVRMADTALASGYEVKIFLMNDGVDLARQQTKPENAEFDLGKMLLEIQNKGGEIKLCTTCINRCGIAKGDLLDKSWPAGMKDLINWTAEADRVITF